MNLKCPVLRRGIFFYESIVRKPQLETGNRKQSPQPATSLYLHPKNKSCLTELAGLFCNFMTWN